MSWSAFEETVRTTQYLTLATVDSSGLPWASPVWFATVDCQEFFWVSSPNSRHSRNLAGRPQLAISIFDSRQPPGTGTGVYLSAVAEQVSDDRLDEGLAIFSTASLRSGMAAWGRPDVEPPARLRLYHAIAHEHFVLSDRDERIRVTPV